MKKRLRDKILDAIVWDQCGRCGRAFPASEKALDKKGLCPYCLRDLNSGD